MVSGLTPYSTFMDLSAVTEFQEDNIETNKEPLHSNHILRSQSLNMNEMSGKNHTSRDYSDFGPVGSLEDFQKFTNGYDCTSSQFGSLEGMEMFTKKSKDPKADTKRLPVVTAVDTETESSLFDEIQSAMKNEQDSTSTMDNQGYLCFHIEMLPSDKRFGFSVSGGIDEGKRPKIDKISKGMYDQMFVYK